MALFDEADNPAPQKVNKRKASEPLPWFKFYQEKWLEDTRVLTPEARGLYVDVLALIYKAGGPIDDDVGRVAHYMHVHVRVWKRVRSALLAHGFLYLAEGKLHQKRAQSVLAERGQAAEEEADESPIIPGLFADHSATKGPKLGKKSNVIKADFAQSQSSKSLDIEVETPTKVESVASGKTTLLAGLTLKEFSDKLMEAGGSALANPASYPSILMVQTPIAWLNGGCDLELDILPTIRAKAASRPPGSISTWNYLTKAVAEAKARREAGLPPVDPARPREAQGRPSRRAPEVVAQSSALADQVLQALNATGGRNDPRGSEHLHGPAVPQALRLASPGQHGGKGR